MVGSDFAGTSPKLFWPEALVYLLPGAELNQMLTLIIAMNSETPCEPELLLFAGMNDHLHAAGLLEYLRSGEPTTKKIWEAVQTLFAAMNEVQELATSRLGSKTRVADVSHALRGFYDLADILIVLDEFLCLEVSIFGRHLNFNPEVGDDHPVIAHLTASL